MLLMMATFFVVAAAALSLGMYDKQEPTNVFVVDKPKYTKELNECEWIEAQSYAKGWRVSEREIHGEKIDLSISQSHITHPTKLNSI